MQRIIDAEYARREFNEIPAGDFTDMQYLFLIQEEAYRGIFTGSGPDTVSDLY